MPLKAHLDFNYLIVTSGEDYKFVIWKYVCVCVCVYVCMYVCVCARARAIFIL